MPNNVTHVSYRRDADKYLWQTLESIRGLTRGIHSHTFGGASWHALMLERRRLLQHLANHDHRIRGCLGYDNDPTSVIGNRALE